MRNKPKSQVFEILLVVLISLLCLFFLGEITFRLYSLAHENWILSKNRFIFLNQPNYTILCIGDYFTRGNGTGPGESYPDHLQRMVDNHFGDGLVRVLNKGISSGNTFIVRGKIDKWMALNRVNMAILQIGSANEFDPSGYSEFLKDEISLRQRIFDFGLNYIAWFRFMYSLHIHLTTVEQKNFQMDADFEDRDLQDTSDRISEIENQKFLEILDFIRQFADYSKKERTVSDQLLAQSNLEWLVEMGKEHPRNPLFFLHQARLRLLFFLDIEKGCEAFTYYLDLKPDALEFVVRFVNMVLNQRYLMNPNTVPEMPDLFWRFLKQRFPDKKIELAVSYFQVKMIDDWVKADLQNIIDKMHRRGVTVILQTFPPQHKLKHYRANQTIREIAAQNNLSLIDQEKIFSDLWSRDSFKIEDFYLPTGNKNFLSSGGHKFAANNIFKIIKDPINLYLNSTPVKE